MIFIVVAQAYLGLGEARNIVRFDVWYAMYFGIAAAGFVYWAIHPTVKKWQLHNGPVQEPAHTLVRITEDRITEPVIALPAPRYRPEPVQRPQPDARRYRARAGQYSNKVVAPQIARRQALANRFTDDSVSNYEKYIPRNNKTEYMY